MTLGIIAAAVILAWNIHSGAIVPKASLPIIFAPYVVLAALTLLIPKRRK